MGAKEQSGRTLVFSSPDSRDSCCWLPAIASNVGGVSAVADMMRPCYISGLPSAVYICDVPIVVVFAEAT